MAKFIRRITVVGSDELTTSGRTLYKSKKKKKRKVAGWLKPVERRSRRFAQGTNAFTKEFLRLYNKSSRKRRGRWLFDTPSNTVRATQKFIKKFARF